MFAGQLIQNTYQGLKYIGFDLEQNGILECFQWNNNYNKEEVCEELADVFNYCFQLATKLDVDPKEIILNKLEKTRKKYPVEKSKGVSTKYNKL